jgi:hypothetical protein
MKENRMRDERLQIMLSPEELVAVEDFRFKKRMPSRAAAVRELLRRGLAAEGFRFSGFQVHGFWGDWRRPQSDAERRREALITNFHFPVAKATIGRKRGPRVSC